MQIEKNWYYWPLNRTSNTAGAIRYFNTVLLWRHLAKLLPSQQIQRFSGFYRDRRLNIFAIFLGFSLYKSLYKRMETGKGLMLPSSARRTDLWRIQHSKAPV